MVKRKSFSLLFSHTTYIKILNYIINAPTCFGVSSPSSGSFNIVFAEVMNC